MDPLQSNRDTTEGAAQIETVVQIGPSSESIREETPTSRRQVRLRRVIKEEDEVEKVLSGSRYAVDELRESMKSRIYMI